MSSEIEHSLVETIQKSELSDLALDVSDAFVSPIPIFGSLSKLWGGLHSIHGYFYAKKVLAFLRELDSIPKERRNVQLSKMLVVPGEKEKFGEHLALLLDRMNEVEKAKMMGRVAKAFIEGSITLDDMKSLNFALDAIDLRLTGSLKAACEVGLWSTTQEAQMLAQCGLTTPKLSIETTPLDISTVGLAGESTKTERHETFKSAEIQYRINRLGKLFVAVCLN